MIRAHGKQVWRSLKTNDRLVAKQELERVQRGLRASGILIKKKLVPTFLSAIPRLAEACERDGMRSRYLGSLKDRLRIAGRSFLGSMQVSTNPDVWSSDG